MKLKTPILLIVLALIAAGVYQAAGDGFDFNSWFGGSEEAAETSRPNEAGNVEVEDVPKESEAEEVLANPGWETYENSRYNFNLEHPPGLTVGITAPNSVLGTYDEPVAGIFVGNYVFISQANYSGSFKEYFGYFYDEAFTTQKQMDEYFENAEGPAAACLKDDYQNPTVTIKAVTCAGEGGGAFYALLEGNHDLVFIDGYSGGYAAQFGRETPMGPSQADFAEILESFRFTP